MLKNLILASFRAKKHQLLTINCLKKINSLHNVCIRLMACCMYENDVNRVLTQVLTQLLTLKND